MMKFVRVFLIFCYGLFTIAAQTLLFREFLTAFEGSEFSVGVFFASWFFWIGLGAVAVYRPFKIIQAIQRHIDLLFLVYIPVFVLELILIIQARQIAGINSYDVWPIGRMLWMSLLIGAPISLMTGIFFPLACRWIQENSRLPVSTVYMIEAGGGFAGGIAVTILLGAGVNSSTIFFLLAFLVSLAVLAVRLAGKNFITAGIVILIPAFVLIGLLTELNHSLDRQIQIVKWKKLLPADAMAGSFQTAQAQYIYGTYQHQWVVVREGSTCEVLPDKASAGRVAAIVLAQKPDAKNILVIGSGLALCHSFLQLPQIEKVTWTHSDNQYVQQVGRFLPAEFKLTDSRLIFMDGDIRSQLPREKNTYDIVIINLHDATSSVLNRYFTDEFYRQLKESMTANGIMAVRVTGGENIMGTELIDLGASTRQTLKGVFGNLILVPGDDTWFIASDSNSLDGSARSLQRRFSRIRNIQAVFTPSALASIYLPDRAMYAMESYDSTDLPTELLINKDSRPLASLYSLLLAWKQSGSPMIKIVKLLAVGWIGVFLIPVAVFIVLRFFYIIRTKKHDGTSSFDSSFMVFSAGWLGIGIVIALIYLYQTRFGSLYLHIGIISSLFMAGLTVGAAIVQYLLVKNIFHKALPIAAILIHSALLIAINYLPAGFWTQYHFAAVFFWGGLCTGAYFPIAARQLADSGFETGLSGGKLETADHIGAAVGSLVTGFVLIPVLGTQGTIWILLALILANIPATVLKAIGKPSPSAAAFPDFRKAGYILFGIAASVVICSNYLVYAAANQKSTVLPDSVRTLAGQSRIEYVDTALSDSSEKFRYYKVFDADEKLAGYIYYTRHLAPNVRGFGGKLNLAVHIDTTGKLLNYQIVWSNETPSYLVRLKNWHQNLMGRPLFDAQPFSGIKPVTGATLSSRAILSTIELSSKKFAHEVLARAQPAAAEKKPFLSVSRPDRGAVYLLILTAVSLVVIYWGNFYSRLVVLILNAVIGGFVLNIQYSTDQMVTLLSGQSITPELTGVFLLVVIVPLLILFFGNIYCGYLCPFGAVQELLGYIIPDRYKLPLSSKVMRKGRFVKYVILFILVMVFFICRRKAVLIADPLISVFNIQRSDVSFENTVFVIILFAVIGSIFYRRFWCRYLCPAGAFLSLLNNLILFKRLNTPKGFARCEFGLTASDKLDCIYCDRCRHQNQLPLLKMKAGRLAAGLSGFLLIFVLIAAALVTMVYFKQFRLALPTAALSSIPASISLAPLPSDPCSLLSTLPVTSDTTAPASANPAAPSYGRPRDVDIQKIRTQIEEKKLSDHEAQFYEKLN